MIWFRGRRSQTTTPLPLPVPTGEELNKMSLESIVDAEGVAWLYDVDAAGLGHQQLVMTEQLLVERIDDDDECRFRLVVTFSPPFELLAPPSVALDDAGDWAHAHMDDIRTHLEERFEELSVYFQDEVVDVSFETQAGNDATLCEALGMLRAENDVTAFVSSLVDGPSDGFATELARLIDRYLA